MGDTSENKVIIASRNIESKTTPKTTPGKNPKSKWTGLLVIYVLLFVLTGYFALLSKERNSGYEKREQIASINDQETKTFIIDSLKQEDAEYLKRQDFAMHSFNVVLGALLGFMSASATNLLGGKSDT